ncbi:hypothetical protein [Halobellus salinisoli]|uniref:hypothetical protein n=1 Tax=Halobellus salinisoli TaxID=3108500 RepID=UPI00300A23B5
MIRHSIPSKVKTALSNPNELAGWVRRKVQAVDRKGGCKIYRNAATFRANLAGQIALKKVKEKSNPQLSTEGRPDVSEFKHLGIPYEEKTLNKVKTQYNEVIEDENHSSTLEYDGNIYSYRLDSPNFDFAKHMPAFADLVNDEVIKTVQDSYGSYFKPVRVTAYRNFHIPQEIREESDIYSNRYHTDAHTIDHLKLFVYLDDTSEVDGPFHLIPAQESSEIVKMSSFKHKGNIDVVEEKVTPIKFTGPTGSTALVNVSLQEHRAGVPEPGHSRDIIQFVFAPASEPLPDDWPEHKEMWTHPGRDHNGLSRLLRY